MIGNQVFGRFFINKYNILLHMAETYFELCLQYRTTLNFKTNHSLNPSSFPILANHPVFIGSTADTPFKQAGKMLGILKS